MTMKILVLHLLEDPAVAISVVVETSAFLNIAKDVMLWDMNLTRLIALGLLAAIPILRTSPFFQVPKLLL